VRVLRDCDGDQEHSGKEKRNTFSHEFLRRGLGRMEGIRGCYPHMALNCD
jgi:hypothetical protein